MKNKITTKLTQELNVYQVQYRINHMIEIYGRDKMRLMLTKSEATLEMFRHFDNLVLTYGPRLVWDVCNITFAQKTNKVA